MTNQTPERHPGKAAQSRIAAQRAAARQAKARNRLLLAGGAIVAVVAVIVILIVFAGNSSPAPAAPTGAALNRLVGQVTSVPVAATDEVGPGQTTSPPTAITGSPLTSDGKPEVLYMGSEFCPYCAAQRWALIVALSRFGEFHGLAATHSAAKDGAGRAEPYPNTPTFTFARSRFTSRYLAFTSVEMQTNVPDPATGSYTTLQTPTAAQQALLRKYDEAYQGAIPFVDLGNRYLTVGASYNPGTLSGLTWDQIAADLHNPSSAVARSVLGAANHLTAAMCGLTHDQPSAACTAAVRSLR